MRLSRNTWYLASVTLVLGVFGCNDQPTAGEPFPQTSAADFFTRAPAPGFGALEWMEPVGFGIEESQEIGPEGGVIRLQDMGVEIRFPQGAVSETVLIDAEAIPGSVVAFRFGAHGLTFDSPVEIRIDSDLVSGSWRDEGTVEIISSGRLRNYSRGLLGVYFEGESTSNVIPLDALPIYMDQGSIVLEIAHFSGYAVASGR